MIRFAFDRAGVALVALAACAAPAAKPSEKPRMPPTVMLEDLTWPEAERVLTADAVVVVPIGAASKEHGPHLKLANDWILADYLRHRLAERTTVVVAPIVGLSFYPAFVEYPGSIGLELDTARDVIVQVVRSLARHGPRRFYALNTGISTLRALAPAAERLAADGIVLRYTDLSKALAPVEHQIAQQEGGTHADELETSMMLYIAPGSVDMSRAVKDYHPGTGPLTRKPDGPGTYSPTGSWGDPTLATRAKGERLVQALVDALVADVEALRVAPLP
ncbi:MAG TPA: creatininase family protein [Kofleriaceae bacterium]|nr:creatininase family protein [Kofleriaceae bacterium]